MNLEKFKKQVNRYGKKGTPFLFVIDFELNKPFVCKLTELNKHNIFYAINGIGNLTQQAKAILAKITTKPFNKKTYSKAFNAVKNEIVNGNSYLLNLTFPTKITSKNSLFEIIQTAKAPYKLFYKNKFIAFSPEPFIRIINDTVFTYPMKGTIDASITNAKEKILNDKKETYEHNTIVDLLRNDLAMVATNITINKFRYIDKLTTSKGSILQVSSKIEGKLSPNWKENLGNILIKLLPAGSISGAPKAKTIEIIKQTEKEKRGYYTGVFGVFDGKNIDSAVLIRFIEEKNKQLLYRSGGGITALSNLDFEYDEMLQKIYIPK